MKLTELEETKLKLEKANKTIAKLKQKLASIEEYEKRVQQAERDTECMRQHFEFSRKYPNERY